MKSSFSTARKVATKFSTIVAPVALMLALAAGWTAPPAQAASKTAEGRAAARKAGQLAAQGKCHLAIPQYNKAYEILSDPAILFNRAECLRRIDRAQDALANYQQFLEDLPKAPNRSVAEQRIADLKKQLGIADNGPVKPPAPVAKAPPPPPAKPEPVVAPPPPAPPVVEVPPVSAKPDPVNPPGTSSGIIAIESEKVPPSNSLDSLNLASSSSEPAATVTETSSEPSRTSPWVWIGIGAVVLAGAAIGGFFLLSGDMTDVPPTGLGNYKF